MNLLLLFGSAALCVAWLLPGHYFPWFTFQQEFAAAIGVSLIAMPAWLVRRQPIHWPWLSVLALAAACIPPLQLAAGQIHFVSDAVLASGYLAGFGLCIAAGATLARRGTQDVAGAVMSALAVAAIASVAMCLMQWLDVGTGAFVDGAPRASRYYANFGQPNNLATALAIGVCALLLGYARGAIGPVGTAVGAAFLGFGLVMSQSRTGWLFVALLALWLLLMRRRANLRLPALAIVVGAVLFFAAVAAWNPLNEAMDIASRGSAADRATGGVSRRMIHLQVMWDAVWQQPWFGYGWTQAVLGQQAAVLAHPATGEVLTNSHNFLLDLLLWNGVPIGLMLIASLTWWFARQIWICRDTERLCVLAAVGAIFLHGLLEFPLDYAFFLLPAGLLMGALDGRDRHATTLTLPPATMAVPAVMLCGLIVWVGSEFILQVNPTARTMRFVAGGIGLDKVNTAPEPDVTLLDRLLNLHRYMLTPAHKSRDPNYMPWVRAVATRHPMAPAMLRHALAAGLNGQAEEARLVLARLCKMHSAERCDEGRIAWRTLQSRYHELNGVPYPAEEH